MFFFFFSSRRRHTRSDRDWSSDVCSSDLVAPHAGMDELGARRRGDGVGHRRLARLLEPRGERRFGAMDRAREIGRASCRERVWVSGVAVSLQKKYQSLTVTPAAAT